MAAISGTHFVPSSSMHRPLQSDPHTGALGWQGRVRASAPPPNDPLVSKSREGKKTPEEIPLQTIKRGHAAATAATTEMAPAAAPQTPARHPLQQVVDRHNAFKAREVDPQVAVKFFMAQQKYLRCEPAPGRISRAMRRLTRAARPSNDIEAGQVIRTREQLANVTTQYMRLCGLSEQEIAQAKKSWARSGIAYALGPLAMNIASTAGAAYLLAQSNEVLEKTPVNPRVTYLVTQLVVALATPIVNSITQLYFVSLQELIADRQSNRIKELKAPGYPKLLRQAAPGKAKGFEENNKDMQTLVQQLDEKEALLRQTLESSDPNAVASTPELLAAMNEVTALIENATKAETVHDTLSKKMDTRASVIDLNFTGQFHQGLVRAGTMLLTFAAILTARLTQNPQAFPIGQIGARGLAMGAHMFAAVKDVSDKFQKTWESAAVGIDLLKPEARKALQSGTRALEDIGPEDLDLARMKTDEPVRTVEAATVGQVQEQLEGAISSYKHMVFGGTSPAEVTEMRTLDEKFAAIRVEEAPAPLQRADKQRLSELSKQRVLEEGDAAELADLERRRDYTRYTELRTRYDDAAPYHAELQTAFGEIERLTADLARIKKGDWVNTSEQTREILTRALVNPSLGAKMATALSTSVARYRRSSEFIPQFAQRFGSAFQMVALGTNPLLVVAGGIALENARRTENNEPPLGDAARFGPTAFLTLVSTVLAFFYGYLVNMKVSTRAEYREKEKTTPALQRPAWLRADTMPMALKEVGRSMFAIPTGFKEAYDVRNARTAGDKLKEQLAEKRREIESLRRQIRQPAVGTEVPEASEVMEH